MYDQDEETTRTFKIIIIGDTNVGKTCLAFRFCGGRFPEKTEATIGVDFREKQVTIDGEDMKVRQDMNVLFSKSFQFFFTKYNSQTKQK